MVVALQCFVAYQDLMKEEKKKLDSFRSHTRGAACACGHNIRRICKRLKFTVAVAVCSLLCSSFLTLVASALVQD